MGRKWSTSSSDLPSMTSTAWLMERFSSTLQRRPCRARPTTPVTPLATASLAEVTTWGREGGPSRLRRRPAPLLDPSVPLGGGQDPWLLPGSGPQFPLYKLGGNMTSPSLKGCRHLRAHIKCSVNVGTDYFNLVGVFRVDQRLIWPQSLAGQRYWLGLGRGGPASPHLPTADPQPGGAGTISEGFCRKGSFSSSLSRPLQARSFTVATGG